MFICKNNFFRLLILLAQSIVLPVGGVFAEEAEVKPNILKVAVRQKVRSLDPAFASDMYTMTAISRVYEGLYRYNLVKRPYETEPALAEKLPTVSKNGRIYSITIKKGVRFQKDVCFGDQATQGREMTAHDVSYSFNRLLKPELASPGQWTLEGHLKEIRVKDAYHLEIELKEPYPQFLYVLSLPFLSIVPKECVEFYKEDFGFHPVGTGPFVLKSYNSKRFEWEKNPHYRVDLLNAPGSPDHGKPLPFLDGITDEMTEDDQPVWLNFLKGDHDIITRVPTERLEEGEVSRLERRGIKLLKETAADFAYFAFNFEDELLGKRGVKSKKLRQAMSLAYDTAPVIDRFYSGLAEKAEFLVAPGIAGYDGKFKNPYGTVNLVKAKKLLAEAGFPEAQGLPEFTLDLPGDTRNRSLGEYFQRCMAEIGIKISLRPAPWAEFLRRVQQKQGQIYAVSWLYDYPDAESAFQILYGRHESPGPNKSNFKYKEYDRLYEKFKTTINLAERKRLMDKMRALVVEEAPWIYVVHRFETRMYHPWVKNYYIHLFDFGVERYIRLESRGVR